MWTRKWPVNIDFDSSPLTNHRSPSRCISLSPILIRRWSWPPDNKLKEMTILFFQVYLYRWETPLPNRSASWENVLKMSKNPVKGSVERIRAGGSPSIWFFSFRLKIKFHFWRSQVFCQIVGIPIGEDFIKQNISASWNISHPTARNVTWLWN